MRGKYYMTLDKRILHYVLHGEDPLDVINNGKKLDKEIETRISRVCRNEDRLWKKSQIAQIETSQLYIDSAASFEDSFRFGWNRGNALKLETIIRGRWIAWLKIISKRRYDDTDIIPDCTFTMFDGKEKVNKMLKTCMDFAFSSGLRGRDFLDWIGYGLGIAWFEKPKIEERVWQYWYNNFDISLLYLYPSDYFSTFLIEYSGLSGVGAYFPTPLNITIMMNQIIAGDGDESIKTNVWEGCIGAGAMLLPSKSLMPVGADFNLEMVKASCVQSFLYQPWLLYTPQMPIFNLHFCEKEMRITSTLSSIQIPGCITAILCLGNTLHQLISLRKLKNV
jgi:hypothetical protein